MGTYMYAYPRTDSHIIKLFILECSFSFLRTYVTVLSYSQTRACSTRKKKVFRNSLSVMRNVRHMLFARLRKKKLSGEIKKKRTSCRANVLNWRLFFLRISNHEVNKDDTTYFILIVLMHVANCNLNMYTHHTRCYWCAPWRHKQVPCSAANWSIFWLNQLFPYFG